MPIVTTESKRGCYGVGVTGRCELVSGGARNQTRVLCESSGALKPPNNLSSQNNYFSCLSMHVRLHHVCMYTICMPGDRGSLKEVPVQSHLQVPKLTFPEVCIVENLMELRAKIAPLRADLDHFAASSNTPLSWDERDGPVVKRSCCFWRRPGVQFQASTKWLTAISNFSSRGSDATF